MSANTAQIERLATPYAVALIETAQDKKILPKIATDVADMKAMLADSEDFVSFIKSPIIGRDKKLATVQAIAKKAKLQDITINFLSVLVQNNRLAYLSNVLKIVEREMDRLAGRITAQVTSASVLSAAQTKKLKASLEKALSSDVEIETNVDEAILGGVVIQVGSQMIDDSVKTKLDRLGRRLSNTTGFKTQIKQA